MGRRKGDGVNMDERWRELEWIPRFIVFCFFEIEEIFVGHLGNSWMSSPLKLTMRCTARHTNSAEQCPPWCELISNSVLNNSCVCGIINTAIIGGWRWSANHSGQAWKAACLALLAVTIAIMDGCREVLRGIKANFSFSFTSHLLKTFFLKWIQFTNGNTVYVRRNRKAHLHIQTKTYTNVIFSGVLNTHKSICTINRQHYSLPWLHHVLLCKGKLCHSTHRGSIIPFLQW